MWTLTAIVVLGSALWAAIGGFKLAAVAVPRCCPAGQSLAPSTLRVAKLSGAQVAAACTAAESLEWAPRVYASARGLLLSRGVLPPHWRLVADTRPACESLRVLSEHAEGYVLLANNASLLWRGATESLPTNRYCADDSVVLVCAEDLKWAPAKCCTAGQAVNGSRCVDAAELSASALMELRALAGNASTTTGWPMCPEGSRYALAGALSGAARLRVDGSLELPAAGGEGRLLNGGRWCADAIVGELGVKVLTCEAAAR